MSWFGQPLIVFDEETKGAKRDAFRQRRIAYSSRKETRMDFKSRIDFGRLLTIAGAIVTVAASLITSEQQKQSNHEIAQEVAELLPAEAGKGEIR